MIDDPEGWKALNRQASGIAEVLKLDYVATDKIEAEILSRRVAKDLTGPDPDSRLAEMQIGTQGETTLVFKLVQEEVFVNGEGEEGARVLVELVAGFRHPESYEANKDEVTAFAQTVAPRVLYPFYRETVTSMLGRLGATSLMPGLLTFPAEDD